MKNAKIPTSCPFCLAKHTLMTSVDPNTRPEVGDYNVCVGCKRISIFDKALGSGWRLRKPSVSESTEPYYVELSVLASGV